ncbi:tripartite tricarboxylate transporter substrate binding protein [Pseudooceanicola nanhaiensis]|uniref:tripartite tricarboxylate transporter substrate binding protein n=1 Tax=Pseudooceanicola nanhaiensis TaxID=375761 RepID=UPI001CD7CADF|nr:tripartite tricarboxylate transporter substrate binding protein [Pseudooceanicola nanhaiensis]MCA0920407.1 tripartite tricarboxylate transporter substrate binding protein [Pseudooceanicola nanhaiensis]
MLKLTRRTLMATVAATVALAGAAQAADWPGRKITLIVPYSAGGSADRVARNIAPFLEKELGTSIVVENRPGASSQIGTSMFLAKPADANTLLLNAQPYFSASIALQNAPYTVDDLEVLNVHNVGNISITVKSDSPYQTFADMNDAIKANPGEVSIGTVRGGASHMLTLLLADKLGWDARIVTYDSGAPVRTAVLGGQIDSSTNGAVSDAAMKPEVRSLAISTSTGISAFPDAPYINDVLKDYGVDVPEIGDVRFLAVKAGTKEAHPDRFQKLLDAYEAVMANPEYQAILQEQGAAEETAFRGPEESTKIVKDMDALMQTYKSAFGG